MHARTAAEHMKRSWFRKYVFSESTFVPKIYTIRATLYAQDNAQSQNIRTNAKHAI